MFYKIYLDDKNWNRVTKCIVRCSLAVVWWGGRDDHSIGFVQAKPIFVKFLVFLEKVKGFISIESSKQNLHFQCINIIIIISLLEYYTIFRNKSV
jgi:hypothetical protein